MTTKEFAELLTSYLTHPEYAEVKSSISLSQLSRAMKLDPREGECLIVTLPKTSGGDRMLVRIYEFN